MIQSWGERAFAACSDNAQAASVLSVSGDSVIFHPAIFKNTDGSRDTSLIVFRTSVNEYALPPYIRYDALKQTLEYQYGSPCSYSDETFVGHMGSFNYIKGMFTQTKDTIWQPQATDEK